MIYINKNTSNNFVLTLNETSKLINPYYLFHFRNDFVQDFTPILWSQTDSSNCPNRFNQFNLVEATSGSTTGGAAVSLNLITGQYTYSVFESTNPTMYISGTTGNVVESGRMVVAGLQNDTLTNNNSSIYN